MKYFIWKFAVSSVCVMLATACASHRQPSAQAISGQPEARQWDGSVLSEMGGRYHPTVGTQGMVVADDREAAEWGAQILREGGNAIDAAVATAFAMAVTRPHYASLGGGGFLVYCPKQKPCRSLDYREEAPAAATRDMYFRNGKADTGLSQNGALASGVPGVPAGLLLMLEKWGTMKREKILARPIMIARQGFRFSAHEEAAAQERWEHLNAESKRLFGCGAKVDGIPLAPCTPGALVKQPDLARVLESISKAGAAGFYQGWVAKQLVQGLHDAGGMLTLEDLKSYQPKFRAPVHTQYRGLEVVSMPPPSAGGAVLLQMLGYMERADAQGELVEGYGSARTVHAIAHAMMLGFADRAKHFGDPDQVEVPTDQLLSKKYLDERWKSFSPSKMNYPLSGGEIEGGAGTRPARVKPLAEAGVAHEGKQTTHFSVIDAQGNAVAITTTINDNYGSGFTPPGTGVVMNNEMDDFSVQPGVPNLFGLVGAQANEIGPHKRPLSSMSPTVVRDAQGNARLVLGAAGGPRITTSVFLSILNRLRFGLSLPDSVAASRLHHQWKPAELMLERSGFSADTRQRLIDLGYALKDVTASAKVHALERFPNGRTWGVADFRGEGAAVAE